MRPPDRAGHGPVLPSLSGWCLGAGLEVAVSCDLRVAGARATFGMPEVTVGIPSVIHAALIPAMIGASRAAWLLLTGETIDAGTAASWGLVHDVVPDDELDARTAQLAAHIAALGPQAVRHQKRLLNQWTDMTPARAIEDSIAQFGLAFLTGEPTTRTIKLDITPQKSANLRAVLPDLDPPDPESTGAAWQQHDSELKAALCIIG